MHDIFIALAIVPLLRSLYLLDFFQFTVWKFLYNHYKVSLFSLFYVLPVSRNIERDTVFLTVYQTVSGLFPCPDRHLKVRQTRNQNRMLFFLYRLVSVMISYFRHIYNSEKKENLRMFLQQE